MLSCVLGWPTLLPKAGGQGAGVQLGSQDAARLAYERWGDPLL